MKHLENFGNLLTSINKKENINRIEVEINSAIEKYSENSEGFVKYDINILREKLLKSAKDNNYRGSIKIKRSANDSKSANANKKFIVYEPKNSTMEDIGSAAANARRK